jgi:hypothetical protein
MQLLPNSDIWKYYERGAWVVVTTNTQTRKDGTAIMGAGLAQQAALRFPDLPARYGLYLQEQDPNNEGHPEHPYLVEDHRLILFPTKRDWRAPSPLDLIRGNLLIFRDLWREFVDDRFNRCVNEGPYVAWPPLGCGHGGRDWTLEIEPLMVKHLPSDRHAVVLPPGFK